MSARREAFTLVELLVVLAVIGLLMGITLPAIQSAREASRRMQCQSNLRNQCLAVLEFEDIFRHLPAGRNGRGEIDYAWSFYVLPMLEKSSLYLEFDQGYAWSDPRHDKALKTIIPEFRCPSGPRNFRGDMDYAGITGTLIDVRGRPPFNRGSLVYVDDDSQDFILLASVTDGLSHTIAISERVDREAPEGMWASGLSCISHDRGGPNSVSEGIRSAHSGGACAVRLDNATIFLSNNTEENLLGALLTRSGDESNTDRLD